MKFKEDYYITLTNKKKKKVKAYTYECPILKRTLCIHVDIDNKEIVNISDSLTGYKLLSIPIKPDIIKIDDIQNYLNNFVNHFTIEGIAEEFKRVEKIKGI